MCQENMMLSGTSLLNKMGISNNKLLFYIVSAFIFCITFFVYSGSLGFDYVSDDRINVLTNFYIRGFTLDNILWAFSSALGGHYQPFTWLSYMFDYSVWGLNSYGYRLGNIVLHCINAILFMCLVCLILIRFYSHIISVKKIMFASLIGTLFFSLHPLRVESVVWVTERRDVLSTFFLLISFIFYFHYKYSTVKKTIFTTRNNAYYFSFFFFLFSLLSKAWAITFPIVLVLVDLALDLKYPKKLTTRTVFNEVKDKIPFLICSVIFVSIGIFSAGSSGAMISWEKLTVLDRLLQATYGFNTYLLHTLYPVDLSPLYLLGDTNFLSTKYLVHFIVFLSIFITSFAFSKKFPWPLYLFLIYFVIISPVLGFAQSGPQMMADRYTYIALMPFSFALSWLVLNVLIKCDGQERKKNTLYLYGAMSIAALFIMSALINFTLKQIKIWENEEALWSHAYQLDKTNYMAINNRADYKSRERKYIESIQDYTLSLSLNSSDSYALNGRAASRIYIGDLDDALDDLNTALDILPTYVDAILNRGVVYNNQGEIELAKNDFEKVVELEPGNQKGNLYLGIACFLQGEFNKAIELFTKVYYLNSEYIDAIYYRGLSHAGLNNIHEAKNDFEYILNKSNQELTIYKNAENQLRLLDNG